MGSPAPTTPTTGNTDVVTSGTSVTSPISLQFSGPTTGSACGDGTTLWCLDTGGTQAACVPPNGPSTDQCYAASGFGLTPNFTTTVDQSQTVAPPGEYYAITSITLGVANPVMTGGFASPNGNGTGTAGSRIEALAFICLGGPAVSDCATPVDEIEFEIINLGAGGTTTIQLVCLTPGCGSSVAGLTLSIPTGVTQVGFELEAAGDWASSGLVSMDSFSLSFDEGLETPEPSTFVLVGLAIVGFAIFRNRYRFWHFGQK